MSRNNVHRVRHVGVTRAYGVTVPKGEFLCGTKPPGIGTLTDENVTCKACLKALQQTQDDKESGK